MPTQNVVARTAVVIAQTKGLWVVSRLLGRTCPLAIAGIFVSSAALWSAI